MGGDTNSWPPVVRKRVLRKQKEDDSKTMVGEETRKTVSEAGIGQGDPCECKPDRNCGANKKENNLPGTNLFQKTQCIWEKQWTCPDRQHAKKGGHA